MQLAEPETRAPVVRPNVGRRVPLSYYIGDAQITVPLQDRRLDSFMMILEPSLTLF